MNQENNTVWIISCKTQESGYLVNGTMSVPNDPANRHCVDVLAWISEGNTPSPEFTQDEIDANAQNKINGEALVYLKSTDWLLLRELDGGTTMPSNIKQLRVEARASITK
jgi:hypothetical protein